MAICPNCGNDVDDELDVMGAIEDNWQSIVGIIIFIGILIVAGVIYNIFI